jgi:hypothetical protein
MSTLTWADIVVIGHPGLPNLSREQIEKLFLAASKELPNGKQVIVIDLPADDAIRNQFYQKLVNRNATQIKAHWARLIFTGRGKPPLEMDDSEEIIIFIARSEQGIGYISSADVDDNVKVLLTIPN